MKNKWTILLVLSFLMLVQKGKSQTSIKGDFSWIQVDHMDRIYAIHQQNEISKLNSKGQTLASASFKLLGTLDILDVTNPLKPLLYFENANVCVITDNTFSELIRYDFNRMDFNQVSLCCHSQEDGLWFYNGSDLQLKRINRDGKVIHESQSISYLINQNRVEDLSPTYMREYGNNVYISFPSVGIMVFDQYGNYAKTISIKGIKTFYVSGNVLYYVKDGSIFRYDLETFEQKAINLPEDLKPEKIQTMAWSNGKVYLLHAKGIKIVKP